MATNLQVSPQVFIAIQEHHRRLEFRARAVGLLLARRQENSVLIQAAVEYEFPFQEGAASHELNTDFLDGKGITAIQKRLRTAQGLNVDYGLHQDAAFIDNFAELQLIGWYSTQPQESASVASNLSFHLSKIAKYDKSEFSPNEYVFLSFNTHSQDARLYKCANEAFVEQQLVVLASSAETSAIEGALAARTNSAISNSLTATYDAVRLYNEQVKQLIALAESGALSKDLTLLRELNDILNTFPAQQDEARSNNQLLEQYATTSILSMQEAILASSRIINNVYALKPQFRVKSHAMQGFFN